VGKKKIEIVYIVSGISRWISFEWIVESLHKYPLNIRFIIINSSRYFQNYLAEHEIEYEIIKTQNNIQLLSAFIKTVAILMRWKPHVVHTHFRDANIVGLTAARITGIRKRIHIRHHNTFHHDYAKKGVILDRYSNLLSTDIIAISNLVYKTLTVREKADESKVHIIHHGFKESLFRNPDPDEVEYLKLKYRIGSNQKVIGVISRHIYWKGVQYIVQAFKQILEDYPEAVLFLANAHGYYSPQIRNQLKGVPRKKYRWVTFEPRVCSLYSLFDVFVHTPVDREIEAFGQIYVEALLAGIPSVFTMSGIAHDFIKHNKNALVVPYKDSHEIGASIRNLFDDGRLRNSLIHRGKEDAARLFEFEKMKQHLFQLYMEN